MVKEVYAQEREIQDNSMIGPHITAEHVESLIQGVSFWQPVGTMLTVAALFLKNGSIVIGKSACVSMENYNAKTGQEIALYDAKSKIWELEGYLLKQQLSGGEAIPLPVEAIYEGSI